MTQLATKEKQTVTVASRAKEFHHTASAMAGRLLEQWVGRGRADEAKGRIATALSAAASSANKPEDFYACTTKSIANVIAVSALTGIMVSNGQGALAHAIPRRDRKGEAPKLRYQFTHRGLNALARRSGQTMIPIPASMSDKIKLDDDGNVDMSGIDIDNPPDSWDQMRGIVLIIKELGSGSVTFRGWVPKRVIQKRRAVSDSYNYALNNPHARKSDPWHVWPIEQSMKTAMHYGFGRGMCVIDDRQSVQALEIEAKDDLPDEQPPSAVANLEAKMDEMYASDATEEPAAETVETDGGNLSDPYKRWRKTLRSDSHRDDVLQHLDEMEADQLLTGQERGVLLEIGNQRLDEIEKES